MSVKIRSLQMCVMCASKGNSYLTINREIELLRHWNLFSDLMEPIKPTSYDGCNYIITFLNDYTHFTAAYILKESASLFQDLRWSQRILIAS